MSDFGEYDPFSSLNAVGNPNKIMHIGEAVSGKTADGPIGNTRPANVVAEGLSIDTYPRLFASPAIRKGQSVTKNESLARSMSSRK